MNPPRRADSTIIQSLVLVSLLVTFFCAGSPCAEGQRWAFYTGQHRYRFGAQDARCAQDKFCDSEIHRGVNGQDYSLNFIEFKDDGSLYDPSQLDEALAQLRTAQDENNDDVIVFIYIHGWHNSAEERTQPKHPDCAQQLYVGDVDKFRHCGLEVLANNWKPTAYGAAPRIVGIYLAWHGWDFGWPPLVWVPSYYLRMPKARSIGLIGMQSAIQEIFKEIDKQRDSYFTIAMGHSFGARALEASLDGLPKSSGNQVLHKGILQEFRDQAVAQQKIGPQKNRLPVDMVFYANAATSHADTIRTKKSWDATCAVDGSIAGCQNDPLYFAVSSRADTLTSIVMPIANLLAMPVGYALRGTHYSNGYHLIAAANTPWMQTHDIPRPEADPPAKPPNEGFCFQVPDDTGKKHTYVVYEKDGKAPSRFWAMNSDHWIASLLGFVHKIPLLRRTIQGQWVISSHGDVWNTGVFNMVRGMAETQIARANGDDDTISCEQNTTGQQPKAPK